MTPAAAIPVLTTDRLTLRAPRRSDAGAVCGFFASDRSAIIGGPSDEAGAWRRFGSLAGGWVICGFGWWLIADRETDTPLGMAGIHHPTYKPQRELGWFLTGDAEGKGLATEAAAAARDWAFANLNAEPLVSYIGDDNPRSQAVARRLGARLDGPSIWDGVSIWRHERQGGAA